MSTRLEYTNGEVDPVFDEKLFFHVRKHEEAYNVQFSLYDWDKASSK